MTPAPSLSSGGVMEEIYDLWCDLLEEYDGYAQSLTRYAKNPSGIHKGERIRVGDSYGWRCIADVVEVRYDTVVRLRLDPTTFYSV